MRPVHGRSRARGLRLSRFQADIQLAAGLVGGSGALYKHFPSKRAVLEAGIDRHLRDYAAGYRAVWPLMTGDVGDVPALLGRAILDRLAADGDIVRITFATAPDGGP